MDFKEFGKEISKLRKEQKITQEELATDLNISRATIGNLENAKTIDIGFKKVLQIVDYLGFELNIKTKSPFPTLEELQDERD